MTTMSYPSIIKTLDGLGFYWKLVSGAVQKVHGNVDSGIWNIENVTFFVPFNFPENEVIYKELPADLAQMVNWKKIQEKINAGDYTNLPSRKDFDKQSPQDFLLAIGAIEIQTVPNQWVNGQPAQQLYVKPEYQVIVEEEENDGGESETT